MEPPRAPAAGVRLPLCVSGSPSSRQARRQSTCEIVRHRAPPPHRAAPPARPPESPPRAQKHAPAPASARRPLPAIRRANYPASPPRNFPLHPCVSNLVVLCGSAQRNRTLAARVCCRQGPERRPADSGYSPTAAVFLIGRCVPIAKQGKAKLSEPASQAISVASVRGTSRARRFL